MRKNLKLSRLTVGDVRRAELPDGFVERVKVYKAKLADVERGSIEEALDGFRRDAHPEQELIIWERIADTYAVYISRNGIDDQKTKKDVLRVLLGISMTADDFSEVHSLTPEQIKVLAYNYRGFR